MFLWGSTGHCYCCSANPFPCPPQVLQSFVDLVSRVTRLELSKPRVYENEFSKVQTESDGSITVLNTRYKTRIRDSKQVCYPDNIQGRVTSLDIRSRPI